MEEKVVLVDLKDQEISVEEKIKAHKEGKLHRAFSIFIFNNGCILLQRRALSKYHSPGLWSNTCCSHPRPLEEIIEAAHRRLKEEMGFDCELSEKFAFVYSIEFANGLKEKEFDHVLVGKYSGQIMPNSEEVEGTMWMAVERLGEELKRNPENFTEWLKISFPLLKKSLQK